MRANLSPMYEAPAAFWETRLKITQGRLERARERQAAATTPALQAFWAQRVKSAQRRVDYLQKRAAKARAPGGMGPHEIAERWLEALKR